MNEQQKSTVIRFAIIFGLIMVGFLAILIKIVITQTADRDKYTALISKYESKNIVTKANRGNIYDSHHRLLAGSAPYYRIYMDTKTESLREKNGKLFREKVDSLSRSMSALFGDRTAAAYKQMLTEGYREGNRRLLLYPDKITYLQMQAVKDMPLFNKGQYVGGLICEEGHRRVNPFGSLAARSIGRIYGENGRGSSGLEMQFEDVLAGKDGRQIREMVDGRVVSEVNEKAEDGRDIVTTLDADLQDFVENSLRNTLNRLEADWGCCILMEVKTGEIKAISNLGLSDGVYTENKNYAVTRVEPGSTFKTYALMAALDDGKVKLTDSIDTENGVWRFEGSKKAITDVHKYDHPLTVEQVLSASSNVGMAKIVTEAYEKSAEKFVRRLDRMGVRDSIDFEIPGTQHSRISIPNDKETLARMAFGYYVELTPLDILMFYNAIANDGKMIRPLLVKAIEENGKTIETFSTETVHSSICKGSTLRDIQQCLEAVVWDNRYGTASVNPWGGKKAQSKIVRIAGKTGTAQILANGRYQNTQHRITFCGYFPAEAPQYSCICMIQRPRKPYDAGFDCGSTVRVIAEKTMAYTASNPINNFEVAEDSLQLPTIKRGMQADMRIATRGTQIEVDCTRDEWARVNEDYQAVALPVGEETVPNVVGMGARDAVFAIEQTGMRAQISGRGRVVSQSIRGGAGIQKGGTVYLTLR